MAREVVVFGPASGFSQTVAAGVHRLTADEPEDWGGRDSGPTPYDLLLSALGTCMSMTVGMYARRKEWPLESVRLRLRHDRIHARDCADCETVDGHVDRIEVDVVLEGPLLDEAQRARLLEIAGKCPVHRTLQSEISIRTRAAHG